MDQVYLGRIVAIARSPEGRLAALYRVSSRSFPNRRTVLGEGVASIVPKPGHETDVAKNPYIAYNCARVVGQWGVVSNGSHTDPIAEKLAAGLPPRDALVYALSGLDYEHDAYDTPRIAAVISRQGSLGWLGVIRRDGLEVRGIELAAGECLHLSTYEHCHIDPARRATFAAGDAAAACAFVLGGGIFANFTNPVAAVGLYATDAGFALAAADA